ncbi:MAG TPA: MarR family transcriptional regulator [Solirubrobacteraceae bacterium]|nr:MarR family transcriptional regulator [Solirubrobacteraceae bacterium]
MICTVCPGGVQIQRIVDPGAPGSETNDPAELLTDVVPRLYRVLRASLDEDPTLPSLEQLRVMGRIAEGVRYASALASVRQMRISAMTPVIDALAQRRWLSRQPDPSDRRKVRLELTQAGRRALAARRRRAGDRLREVLSHGDSGDETIDIAAVAAWLERAVRRYDDERLKATPLRQ